MEVIYILEHYCTKILNHYRKHLSEDIRPYTCFLEDCSQNNPMFGQLQAWKDHVFDTHQKFEGWRCPFCQPSSAFGQETDLLHHIQHSHYEVVAEGYLEDLAAISEVYRAPALDVCPICSMLKSEWEAEKQQVHEHKYTHKPVKKPTSHTIDATFLDHIGQCMHTFALRSLPAPSNNAECAGRDELVSNQSYGYVSTHSQLSGISAYSRQESGGSLTKAQLQSAFHGKVTVNIGDWVAQVFSSSFGPHDGGGGSELREFLERVDACTESAVVKPRPLATRAIVSLDSLRSWLTTERARSLLLYVEGTPSYEDAVRTSHLAVFSILLSINKGIYISTFIRHDHMADVALPFHSCDAWPEVVQYIFEEFNKAQWKFCPQRLDFRRLHDIWLDNNVVLPFKEKQILKGGEDSVIFKVELFEEYNHLITVRQLRARA